MSHSYETSPRTKDKYTEKSENATHYVIVNLRFNFIVANIFAIICTLILFCSFDQNFHECAAPVNMFMFSTHEMKYIWYSPKKKQIFFLFYTIHRHFPIHKAGGENAKTKHF